MRAQLDLRHRVGETQIDRRGVNRIAADDQQQINLAGVHVGDEVAQGVELIHRLGFDRRRVDDGLADVAKRLIHRVREGVDRGRLPIPGDDEAAPAMGEQVLGNSVDPPTRPTFARPDTLELRRGRPA